MNKSDLKHRIDAAAGRVPADLVLRNGRIINVYSCDIHEGDVAIVGNRIVGIGSYEGLETIDLDGRFVSPGFIDGHVHIESSMLNVPEYARTVAVRGTVCVIADPHEIANVMGAEGIRYMLASAKRCPIHVYMMASSCVPASQFESSGAELSALDLQSLLGNKWVIGLAEMMNYPGVIAANEDCLQKIRVAGQRPIDGHAPGVTGRDLCAYATAGIESDHECTTLDEAKEKLRQGFYIMIRQGSAARNLDALLPLVRPDTLDRFIFVTDDKDIGDLKTEGHMDHMIRRAIEFGIKPVHAIKMASLNTARYFGLKRLGGIAPGRFASFAILNDLEKCTVSSVYHLGKRVAHEGQMTLPAASKDQPQIIRSSINVQWIEPEHFAVPVNSGEPRSVHVIEVREARIDTERSTERLPVVDGCLHADPSRDVCKIAVIERHQASGRIAVGFVRGFGFSSGAIASTVSHDAHNLVVAGTNDRDMYEAAIHLVKIRGGQCAVDQGRVMASVPLPIAGLMTDVDADTLDAQLSRLHEATATLNGKLRRPFMALSFLCLSVIGKLKITDRGLVDADKFELIDLMCEST